MSGVGPRRPNTVTAVTQRAANRRIDLHFCSSASSFHALVITVVVECIYCVIRFVPGIWLSQIYLMRL
jgi:hypothetical protein